MGASLTLEKLFSRSSFYDILCFSIFAIGPHFDATITPENVARRCGPLIMGASLVLETFLVGPEFRLWSGSRSLWPSFGWFTKRNFSEGPALSIGPFQKVQHEVIYFPYVARKKWKTAINCPKFVAYMVNNVKFLVHIIFMPWDDFIIYKMNEKPGQMYQKFLMTYLVELFCGRSRISPMF